MKLKNVHGIAGIRTRVPKRNEHAKQRAFPLGHWLTSCIFSWITQMIFIFVASAICKTKELSNVWIEFLHSTGQKMCRQSRRFKNLKKLFFCKQSTLFHKIWMKITRSGLLRQYGSYATVNNINFKKNIQEFSHYNIIKILDV